MQESCRGEAWELGNGGNIGSKERVFKGSRGCRQDGKDLEAQETGIIQNMRIYSNHSINQQWNGEEPTLTSTFTKKQSGMFYFFSLFNVNVITTSQSYRYGTYQHQQVCLQWNRFDRFSQTHHAKSTETENSIRNTEFDIHILKMIRNNKVETFRKY